MVDRRKETQVKRSTEESLQGSCFWYMGKVNTKEKIVVIGCMMVEKNWENKVENISRSFLGCKRMRKGRKHWQQQPRRMDFVLASQPISIARTTRLRFIKRAIFDISNYENLVLRL